MPIIGLPDSISYPPMRTVTQPNPDVGILVSWLELLPIDDPRMNSSVASAIRGQGNIQLKILNITFIIPNLPIGSIQMPILL